MKTNNKKSNIYLIVLSIIFISGLITALCVYLFYYLPKHKDNTPDFNTHYEKRLNDFAIENKRLGEVDVVFLGDSITEGCNLHTLYPNYVVANRGINGDTTFGLEDRLKISAYDLNPKVICLLIGINNIENMLDNYEDIIIKLKTNLPNSKLIILSLTPTGLSYSTLNSLIVENNEELKNLAQKHNATYIDIHSELVNKDTNEINRDYTFEGLHITTDGYEVIANKVTPILDNLIEK